MWGAAYLQFIHGLPHPPQSGHRRVALEGQRHRHQRGFEAESQGSEGQRPRTKVNSDRCLQMRGGGLGLNWREREKRGKIFGEKGERGQIFGEKGERGQIFGWKKVRGAIFWRDEGIGNCCRLNREAIFRRRNNWKNNILMREEISYNTVDGNWAKKRK